jgi:UDP-2-acetamido-3-amino-2,3-dideoxy-glucuronate N-acetyltransferase
MTRVGLIGCGAWGKNLARNLHSLGALAALCDAEPDSLQRQAELYPKAACFSSVEALLASGSLDAVMLASPAPSHDALINAAFDAKLDVYCEKPLTVDLAQAEALAARAEREGRVLMVGHLLRYHPAFERLQQLVAKGELGELRYIAAHRLALGAFRHVESALWDLSPHDVAMVLALAGDRLPERVLATGAAFLHPGIEDMVHSHLQFSGGLRAHCYANWLNPVKEHRLIVIGSKASAIFDDTRLWDDKLTLFRGQVALDAAGVPRPNQVQGESLPMEPGEPLRNEVEHFLARCQDRQAPRSDGREALRVMRVCAAAQRSIEADGEWQSL